MNNKPIPKKIKKKTNAQLKKQLDKIFSEYVRKKYADNKGGVSCYTCGAQKYWKEMQCGHFVSRAKLATRYDERNCRPQDVGCNVFGGGKISIFAERLERELGVGIVMELYKLSNTTIRYYPYEEKIAHYKEKIKELDERV